MDRKSVLAWVVSTALAVAWVVPATGWAAERCVLGELFTSLN